MTALTPPATIAFIGLGMMGRPMASRLAGRGLQAARVRPLAEGGVGFRRRPSDRARDRLGQGRGAGRRCADHHAARRQERCGQALLEGRDAAVEGLGAGALVMDMSSSNPVDTQKLARDLAGKGLALLDAPVSGGVKRAVDGSLVDHGRRRRGRPRARAAGVRRHGQDHHAVRPGRRGPRAEGARTTTCRPPAWSRCARR